MGQRLSASWVPLLLVLSGACQAGELNIQVILSGHVVPGVYGQVQLGNAPQPPLVYAQPLVIVPRGVYPSPVYLHVPPGHARNWRNHCQEYNACNRPVYFIRSAEYASVYGHHDHDEAGRERGRERRDEDGWR